jgi:hypothetical protein
MEGLAMAQKLISFNKDLNLLALEIYELLERHQKGEKLSSYEYFLLGLRWSEFYCPSDSFGNDQDYYIAACKRDEYLKMLNIKVDDMNEAVDKLYKK